MNLCGDSDAFNLTNPCVRGSWASLAPSALVLAICLSFIKPPVSVRKFVDAVKSPFTQYLSLHEAEGIVLGEEENIPEAQLEVETIIPLWRTVVFMFIGLLECLAWLANGTFLLITGNSRWEAIQQFLVALTWLYAIVRPILRPTATPPYDMLTLHTLQIAGGTLQLGGYIFQHVWGAPLPGTLVLAGLSVNLAALVGLVAVIMGMPLALPSYLVNKKDIGSSVSPEDYTTLWGWVTFTWVYPLIKRGRDTTLHEKDVWNLSPNVQSRPLFIKFNALPETSLLAKLWAANSLDIVADFILTLFGIIFNYAGPFFLKQILDALDTNKETAQNKGKAYIYAILMFFCSICKSQCDVQHLWRGRRACTRIRSELMAAIYEKALKRRDFSGVVDQAIGGPKAGVANTAKIVNLMSGDANKIALQVSDLHGFYGAPLEVVIASVFLYQLLGLPAFAGFVVLPLAMPLTAYFSRLSARLVKEWLKAKDARTGVLTELINAVKLIKFFAWEQRWIDRILEAREKELKWWFKVRLVDVGFFCIWVATPVFISVISFLTYVMLGNELTIGTAFTAIALFTMIRQPLNVLPNFWVKILQTRVSIDRIAAYLDEAEVSEQVSTLKKNRSSPASPESEDDRLGFENASFKWNEVEEGKDKNSTKPASEADAIRVVDESATVADHKFELKNLSIIFPEGKLTVVTGPTASGKTALLLAALGEMTSLPGGRIIMAKNTSKIDVHGNMHALSYAAQTPWLRHQSIRDNILFGCPFDESRYNDVIECCALRTDLDILEDGDATEIGEKGISLSGGQKARVALARAVYARTKYVLLDDPLSAVDSHTSQTLYEKCLRGPLLANRTVVLVTHHLELVLPGAHYLVRMLDGRIDTQGIVGELRAGGILDEITQEAAAEVEKEELTLAEETDVKFEEAEQTKKPRKLVEDEHREVRGVKWEIYKTYLKASSYTIWSLVACLVILLQLLGVGERIWMKIWGEAYREKHNALVLNGTYRSLMIDHQIPIEGHFGPSPTEPLINWPSAAKHPLFYVTVYAAIGLTAAFVNVVATVVEIAGGLRASRRLFKAMLLAITNATFRFHDTTPQGRILNRFGQDIGTIDATLTTSLRQVNSSLIGFFAAVLTVTVVFPVFLIPALFIGWFYYIVAVGYLNTGRDLRRMEANSRSPIYSDFGELLNGIVTVRAFSAEKRFLDNIHVRIDLTTKMWHTFWITTRWLVLNFDFLGSLAVFFTSISSIHFLVDDAGLAGLAITSALSFTTSVYYACTFWTGLELNLNAVERVVEYTELPRDPPTVNESNRPPAYWPSSAQNDSLIVAENLSVKYAPDLPAVLQDVSFSLKAGERIGLLGRTGSGKSTLAMSILRFTDPSSGRILIDGIDISKIGTQDLRSRVTFIPQDATLFSGTLRENLDPFDEYDDAACLEVLYRVQMISRSTDGSRPPSAAEARREGEDMRTGDSVSTAAVIGDGNAKTTVSLDTQVAAGGSNFSQGQKQLIALARALLRRSAVVVLDEATSSVDFETDARIQTAIREEFSGSLLLTIAHRLKTVIDYDRLLVLDKGKLVEFDTPLRLIEKEDGIFRNMCLKSGYFMELEASARTKAERDRMA